MKGWMATTVLLTITLFMTACGGNSPKTSKGKKKTRKSANKRVEMYYPHGK